MLVILLAVTAMLLCSAATPGTFCPAVAVLALLALGTVAVMEATE